MSEKVHTPFHVGGTYTREILGQKFTGVLLGSAEKRNGRRNGHIYMPGSQPSDVIEFGDELDSWTLVAAQASSDMLDKLPIVFGIVEDLSKRLKALEKERK